jgi:NADPH-dependent 2,4-dienoyl-CoA reductase/sulfur reductase-like enzyme
VLHEKTDSEFSAMSPSAVHALSRNDAAKNGFDPVANGNSEIENVIIVGAGPAGLMLAQVACHLYSVAII